MTLGIYTTVLNILNSDSRYLLTATILVAFLNKPSNSPGFLLYRIFQITPM